LNVDRNCDGRVNGVYSTAPCSNEFNHCYNGKVTIKTCPRGLVFNPDSNQCDFDSNVAGCASRAEVTCSGRQDGSYTIGCSSSFFFCSNGLIHPSTCQNGLFYDVERKTCDHKFRVRACGGHPEVQREPVTRPPLLVPTYAPQTLRSFAKIGGYGRVSANMLPSCEGKYDGMHSIGTCMQQYMFCANGVSQLAECSDGEVFASTNNCAPVDDLPECQIPTSAAGNVDCSSRPDGFYGASCSPDFVHCSDGVAHHMSCPSTLVFNEAKGHCDYPENCSVGSESALIVETPSAVVTPQKQPSGESRFSKFCEDKKDGFYAEKCSVHFISCNQGVATDMNCPAGLLFDDVKGYCNYPEGECFKGSVAEDSPEEKPFDCKGKKDGFYSNGCSAKFVYCADEVASPMVGISVRKGFEPAGLLPYLQNCPPSLVFNEKKGYCDYLENCSTTSVPAPAPIPVVPPQSSPAAQYAPPAPSKPSIDCKGKKDGYYSNGCSADFVYCVDGVASPMTCPPSLVFNEKKGYCDYLENCSTTSVPAPAPIPVVPPQSSPAAQYAPPAPSKPSIDCKGKKDGYYSNGCTADFVYCGGGVASAMTCPPSLVFNGKKGYCDYLENCSADPVPSIAAAHTPIPVVPSQPTRDSQYTRAALDRYNLFTCSLGNYFNRNLWFLLSSFVALRAGDCTGKQDGFHSNGCSSDFIYCAEGVTTFMKCPSSLVFNADRGYCDYPENCHDGRTPTVVPVPVAQNFDDLSVGEHSTALNFDCAGRSDGYYSDKCSPDFVLCSDGVATLMKCPSSLIFNAAKGFCDYPDNCGANVPAVDVPVKTENTPSTSVPFVCPEPNGVFSNGCVAVFFVCSEGVARQMICPGELVFNAMEGYCDHREYCHGAESISHNYNVAVTESPMEKATSAVVKDVVSSEYSFQSPAVLECTNLPDGQYGSPCNTRFILCSNGVVYYMTCPKDLVFDSKQSRCVFADECGGAPLPHSPADVVLKHDVPVPSRGAQPSPVGTVAAWRGPFRLQSGNGKHCTSDCVGKPDGLHSLGCTSEFLQCVDGKAYSLYCPAGLVFVKEIGVCDIPSACSNKPSHDVTPVSYKPIINNAETNTKDAPERYFRCIYESPAVADCDTDGYYAKTCSSEFFNCVDGKKFVGTCPTGLVFNVDKNYCDYPENCAQGEDAPSVGAQPVPSTVVYKGLLYFMPFSLILRHSDEFLHSDSSCEGHPDGVVADNDCQPEFTTCMNNVAFVTKCPAGLVYSISAKLCDYPESCGSGSSASPPSATYEAKPNPPVAADSPSVNYQHSSVGEQLCSGKPDGPLSSSDCRPSFSFCVSGALYSTICPEGLLYSFSSRRCEWASECGNVRVIVTTPKPVQYVTVAPVRPPVLDKVIVPSVDEFNCKNHADGRYSLGCVGRFVLCSGGRAYVRSCPSGLVFNKAKGLCDYDCDSPPAGTVNDIPHEGYVRQTTPTPQPPSKDSSVQTECVISVAMGRCSSRFWRCKNGRLESAQCPGQSLFDETLSLCVYDLPECQTGTVTATVSPAESTTTVSSGDVVYPTSGADSSGPVQQTQTYGVTMDRPSAPQYQPFVPFPFPFFGGGLERAPVHHSTMKFEPRSILADDRRHRVFDIFDGIKSPWLYPGINRIFVPNHHKHHRDHDKHGDEVDVSKFFDIVNPELPVPVQVIEDSSSDPAWAHKDASESIESVGQKTEEGVVDGGNKENEEKVEREGSGEEQKEHMRTRRSAYDRSARDYAMCDSSRSPGLVSIGFCRQDFIFCRSTGVGVLAACPVGDLFDSNTNKCVLVERCGEPEQAAASPAQATNARPYTPAPPVPVTVPSVPVVSPAHAVPVTTTTSRPVDVYPPPMTTTVASRLTTVYPPPVTPGTPVPVPVIGSDSQHNCDHDTDFAVGCSGNFMKCVHGTPYPMKCPEGLVFDDTKQYCDYPGTVPACVGVENSSPRMDSPTDRTGDGDPIRGSYPDSPAIGKSVEACPQGPQPVGPCSPRYVICANGIHTEMNCASPLVFNPSILSCDFREYVSECANTPAKDSPIVTVPTPAPLVAPAASTCVYDEKRPAFALDYCARTYGMCTEHGVLRREECSIGFLFDSHLSTCVPAEQCGQERLKELLNLVTVASPVVAAREGAESAKYASPKDDRCSNSLEGAVKPLGRCRSSFIRCMEGKAVIEPCATAAEVFSSAVGACVLRINAPECSATPQRLPQTVQPSSAPSNNDPLSFCKTRTDGLYRNPTNCAGILQCFGGDVFEYPSCSSGLVFDEKTGKCGYRDAVPECRVSADEAKTTESCRGAKHGEFIADETNCQQFYRCVWDRLEPMRCPTGAVFNPSLSLCDWPDNVPQCRSADQSTY
uniref:Peritrophin n=1 Tax=Nippostrongylus brasiliensis TaxID=27835 RepID=A0A0N4XTQ7_NIPBR